MSCILGIDFGVKRLGVALGYVNEKMALPLTVLTHDENIMQAIKELLLEHESKILVFGLPKTLKNQEEDMAEQVRMFAKSCQEHCGCDIFFIDERLSSKQVSRQMSLMGISQKKQRGKVDAHAAAVILESFLNEKNPK